MNTEAQVPYSSALAHSASCAKLHSYHGKRKACEKDILLQIQSPCCGFINSPFMLRSRNHDLNGQILVEKGFGNTLKIILRIRILSMWK